MVRVLLTTGVEMGDTKRRRLVLGWRMGDVAAELAAERVRFMLAGLASLAFLGLAFLVPFGGAGELGDFLQIFLVHAFFRRPGPPLLFLSRQAR